MKDVRVVGIHGNLVLCSIADQTLVVGEGNIRRGRSITLVVGDDLDTIVLPDTYTPKQMDENTGQGTKVRSTYEYVVPRSIPIAFEEDIANWG
jgi:hypothetical protein